MAKSKRLQALRELKELKEKMEAFRAGDLAVEADNPHIVKCWERLGCDKKDCPAYGRLRCWSIAGTYCHGTVQGTFAQKLGDCRQCVVYRESCGDEIGELLEAFNQMVKDFRFALDEREQTIRRQQADEQRHAMEEMVAALAHETRNPLHSIGMAASYLKKHFRGELLTEFLSIIEEEVRKLNDLTSLFMSFAHPPPLRLSFCRPNELMGEVAEDVRAAVAERGVRVEMELDPAVDKIVSDQARLREALDRLVENAREAVADGGEIRLATRLDGERLRLVVEDNGPGIAPEERDKIFRPFHSTKLHGPGLGLTIVERIARELSGSVEVESEPGRGAIFTLLLPLVDDAPSSSSRKPPCGRGRG